MEPPGHFIPKHAEADVARLRSFGVDPMHLLHNQKGVEARTLHDDMHSQVRLCNIGGANGMRVAEKVYLPGSWINGVQQAQAMEEVSERLKRLGIPNLTAKAPRVLYADKGHMLMEPIEGGEKMDTWITSQYEGRTKHHDLAMELQKAHITGRVPQIDVAKDAVVRELPDGKIEAIFMDVYPKHLVRLPE